jgi:hypothetical protein
VGKDVAEFEAMIVDEEVNVRDVSFFQGMGRTVISQMIAIAGSSQVSMMHFCALSLSDHLW